jgi:carbon storage regulator
MLILTRRIGETLTIGDDIEITVLGIRGNHLRMGVDAPESFVILREELTEQIDERLEGVV